MRHRKRGRKLGRNASHRRALFRNMASQLIRSVRVDEEDKTGPKIPGRIVTTLAKAKELRPYVEKLVTMGIRGAEHAQKAHEFKTTAERNTAEWKKWRESDQWNKWNQAVAPSVALRRRAFSILRDREAVSVLFSELAERFADRPGGYTRVVRRSSNSPENATVRRAAVAAQPRLLPTREARADGRLIPMSRGRRRAASSKTPSSQKGSPAQDVRVERIRFHPGDACALSRRDTASG
jgi:large subunit ribosomal protein L17